MTPLITTNVDKKPTSNLTQFADWAGKHWLAMFCIVWGAWVILPFLAPVFMKLNMTGIAHGIYLFYSVQCHQFPQRSFFLFGEKLTYNLSEFASAPVGFLGQLQLRQFIGNAQMGWKVAWSDRMVALYGSIWVFSLLYTVLRRRAGRLNVVLGLLLLMPLAMDGISHTISDVWGLGNGFRDSNEWLRALIGSAFNDSFYRGDAWGSFNSLMRLTTGVLGGLVLVWLTLPRLDAMFTRDI